MKDRNGYGHTEAPKMASAKDETAWKLATGLGHIANQLDLWADECLADGWADYQLKSMRELAREIRAALYGFTPSEKALQEIIIAAKTLISDIYHRCALQSIETVPIRDYPIARRLKLTLQELERVLAEINS